jgi:RNA-splicing ligase RtcB
MKEFYNRRGKKSRGKRRQWLKTLSLMRQQRREVCLVLSGEKHGEVYDYYRDQAKATAYYESTERMFTEWIRRLSEVKYPCPSPYADHL